MNGVIVAGKSVSAVFWLLFGVNLLIFSFPSPWDRVFTAVGGTILIIHTVEMLYFMRRYRRDSDDPVNDLLQVLAFGVFHILAMRQEKDDDPLAGF